MFAAAERHPCSGVSLGEFVEIQHGVTTRLLIVELQRTKNGHIYLIESLFKVTALIVLEVEHRVAEDSVPVTSL